MSDEMPDEIRDETAEPNPEAATAATEEAAEPAGDPQPLEGAGPGDAPTAESVDAPGEEGELAAARPSMDGGQLEAIVEALVFASPEPLTPKMLFKLLADEPKDDVQAALDRLVARYEHPGGLHLAQVAGGFQITTDSSMSATRRSCRSRRSRRWRSSPTASR